MESSVQVGKTLLAVSAFSGFLAWDILRACNRRDKWIQGTGLTLTALSVQFLGYFDTQNVNRNSKEEQLRTLVNNQMSLDMSRLVFCTFLACVLPGVAFHSSGGRWANIAAIGLSLCLHTATEIYVLQNFNDPAFRNGGRTMFISSTAFLLVAAISLVLYIALAIICCKFTRDRLHVKIPKMLEGTVTVKAPQQSSKMSQETAQGETPEGRLIREKLGDEKKGNPVFKYWAIVRGCQQEFWLVSSAFSPAVLMIVTTCVAVVVAKAIVRPYLLHRSSTSSILTLYFQCIFIVTGWAILIWRWAVFLFLSVSREAEFFAYREYTKVGVKRFLWLVYLLIKNARSWSPRDHHGSWWKPILTFVWKPLRIAVFFISLVAMLPITLFFALLCLLVLFNFSCWWLSKLLAWSIAKCPYFVNCINKIRDWVADAEVELETCAGEILYVAQSSVKQTELVKEDKDENFEKVMEGIVNHSAEESLAWIRHKLSDRPGDIYSHIGKWKMAAVAVISLLVELKCCEDSKDDVEASKGYSNETLKNDLTSVVKAYMEAKDLLAFLDFPDNIRVSPMDLFHSGSSRAYQMSLEADIKMQEIEKWVREIREGHRPAALAFKDVEKVIKEFKRRKEYEFFYPNTKFYQYWTGGKHLGLVEYFEESDILKSCSMKCVCETICKEPYQDMEGLAKRAMRCLGDIIACAVLRLPEVLPQNCRKWAEDLKEENLIKALKIQEKWRPAESWVKREEENNSRRDIQECV